MEKSLYTKFLLVVITVLSLNFQSMGYAQNLTKIDSLLQEKYSGNTPGATFLISKNGSVIYKKAFGLANLELNVPMKTNNVFKIGSMTKQFTAISILMLMEKGKLNLDDEITKFIPDYPTNGNKITIHHLLTHTSGIKDYTKVKGLNAISQKDLTPLELIDFSKNEPIDFVPGEKYEYNNSGYVILGYIIEKITGQSYANFVEEQIFKKLKMTASQFASQREVIQNRASGYQKNDNYINRMDFSLTLAYSVGGLMSTVDDMFKWQEAIKNNFLISKETTKKAFTNYTLNNGEHTNYGYGWHIKTINKNQTFEHGGAVWGFKSMGVYFPDLDIYVIGLTNCLCNSPTKLTREIAELAVKH
ncbi:CubicO group peptidase, beta-lactamase class C family [Maribacter orientalis]|uniref:CubicO group peptidase, beta-lactamase class C family n=1 Tax=Maribacter orientalis TaxID=228957 RepID=A0A1H7QL25_9FLAO|nr:serine hydrolase domain-containing protein [Maribacter orientalis]SEL48662.1 CubicO group peptidase, beta-lactamase class C family [Maribacter orientalis]